MIITRSIKKGRELSQGISMLEADPNEPGAWQESVPQYDVIINLAGTSIFTLWTSKARRDILGSRVNVTRNVVDALSTGKKGVLLISGSAVGYYGGREDDELLDESSPSGTDFLAQVGREWESQARRAEDFGVRVVLARFGIVLGRNGGALSKMVPAFKRYLGSALGSGKQWFPWIHQHDLFRIVLFSLEKDHISGPINCTAPNPVRNKEMTKILAHTLKRPTLMPAVPSFVVRSFLGEFGSVLLKGQRVVPKRLLDEGFQFRFPTFHEALEDLLD
jgi:uncharacterized protein (TIGR01777 family)